MAYRWYSPATTELAQSSSSMQMEIDGILLQKLVFLEDPLGIWIRSFDSRPNSSGVLNSYFQNLGQEKTRKMVEKTKHQKKKTQKIPGQNNARKKQNIRKKTEPKRTRKILEKTQKKLEKKTEHQKKTRKNPEHQKKISRKYWGVLKYQINTCPEYQHPSKKGFQQHPLFWGLVYKGSAGVANERLCKWFEAPDACASQGSV